MPSGFAYFVFFSFICHVFGESEYNHEFNDLVYCKMSMERMERGTTLLTYENLLTDPITKKPCSYLHGSLSIIYDQSDITDSFQAHLNSIQIVTGYVRLDIPDANHLSMPNLRLIQGKTLYRETYALVLNATDYHPVVINFGNLMEIQEGSVLFDLSADPSHSLALPPINWNSIFAQSSGQHFECLHCHMTTNNSACTQCEQHYCWMVPESRVCQNITKCRILNQRCYFNGGLENQCHSTCSAGCYGPHEHQCFACAKFYHNNTCVERCPDNYFILNEICVKKCPKATEGKYCVSKCSGNLIPNSNGICEKCSGKTNCFPGHKVCDANNGTNGVLKYLSLNDLQRMENCTLLDGSLTLNSHSWKSIKSIESLNYLRSLEVVTGVVDMGFHTAQFNSELKSLSFLSNLRDIQGISHDENDLTDTLGFRVIDANTLEFLGTAALTRVNGSIQFWNTPKLAYGMTVNWTKITGNNPRGEGKTWNILPEQGKCDPSCDPTAGCFGPGNNMCATCRSWRTLNHVCTDNCSSIPGLYAPEMNGSVSRPHRQYWCANCHEECSQTCHGPRDDQCIGGCKNYQYMNSCVSECPHTMYLRDRQCLPCHSNCHSRSITKETVCHGPDPHHCTKCHVLLKTDFPKTTGNITFQCLSLNGDVCPTGTYPSDSSNETDQFKETEDNLLVCRQCRPPCSSCKTVHQCVDCDNVWYRGSCIFNCSQNRVPRMYSDRQFERNSTCPLCHEECRNGCLDGSAFTCDACVHSAFAHSTNETECVKTCPRDFPVSTPEGCKKRKIPFDIIFSSLFAGFVIIVSFVVIVRIVRYYRNKKNQSLTNSRTSSIKIPLTADGTPPNLRSLQLIYSDCLIDPIKLGEGAFGIVYKARWIEKQIYHRNLSDDVNVRTFPSMTSPAVRKLRYGTRKREDPQRDVAVKTLIVTSKGADLFNEAKFMATVDHPNCLSLLGMCITKDNTCLVTEYMPLGSLDKYLHRHGLQLRNYYFILWSKQIADGMKYLGEQGIFHCDLATRNILLKAKDHILITDFGLSRMMNENVNEAQSKFAWRWMSPEVLNGGNFSIANDIWSYGVTLWEIFSLGDLPYRQVANIHVLKENLRSGSRLQQPIRATEEIFQIITQCWEMDSDKRPPFSKCSSEFGRLLKSTAKDTQGTLQHSEKVCFLNPSAVSYSVNFSEDGNSVKTQYTTCQNPEMNPLLLSSSVNYYPLPQSSLYDPSGVVYLTPNPMYCADVTDERPTKRSLIATLDSIEECN